MQKRSLHNISSKTLTPSLFTNISSLFQNWNVRHSYTINSRSDFSKWFYSFLLKLCSEAGKLSHVTTREKMYTSFLSFVCNLSKNLFSTTLDNKITTKLLLFLIISFLAEKRNISCSDTFKSTCV